MELDFQDLYLAYPGIPNYQPNVIVEDDVIQVIIQKYEMLIMTDKGELFGDPNFGCDLPRLLFQTQISATKVTSIIQQQLQLYIQEISTVNYDLNVVFMTDPSNYQDVMIVNFQIADYEINSVIS